MSWTDCENRSYVDVPGKFVPNIGPWGTPRLILRGLEYYKLITILSVLLVMLYHHEMHIFNILLLSYY